MSDYAHKRRIRNYLLNRSYQIRYTAVVVLVGMALTAGLGYFWYDEMRRASALVDIKNLASAMDESAAEQAKEELAKQDRKRLYVLIGFGVLFSVVLSGYGIVLTHKVAGPLHKISRHMLEVKDGKLHVLWDLRRGDQLQEFWHLFKDMHTALRSRTERDVSTLDEVIKALERHLVQAGPQAETDVGPLLQSLRAMRETKSRQLAEGGDESHG